MSEIAAELSLSDGRKIRFGSDEENTDYIPQNISFDTSNPGGFGSASVTLPRPENLYADDAKLFSGLRLYGEGNVTIYDGFVIGVPQVGANEIELQLSGWVTVLDRIETFRQIFVDRDLSRWTAASRAWRLMLMGLGFSSVADAATETDVASALPALTFTVVANAPYPLVEAWYDAGAGNEIESFYRDYTSLALSTYEGAFSVASDDAGTAIIDDADLMVGTNSAGASTWTPSTPKRWGRIRFGLSGTVGSKDQSMTLRRLQVFGNHGLTKRGTAPDQGYYASDIVGHAISQAPSLNYSTDSVETTSFVIPHLTFVDDTSLRSVIEQVSSLGGNQNVPNDWGVYEDKEFYWRSPGTYGRVWHVRRDEVATSSSDGPDADRRVAGVKINYSDGSGTSLSVGPPGSNADYETTELLDSDPDNPAFRIPGAFKSESVGITSQQGAINIGVMILNERNGLGWRGSIEVQGEATDANGNTYPAALIRSGDQIVISDADDPTPRTIVSTSYDHSSLTCTASIGAAPDSLESLLNQLAAVTDLVAT